MNEKEEKLFNYMKDEHDVVLVESDIASIFHIVLGNDEYIRQANQQQSTSYFSKETVDRLIKSRDEKIHQLKELLDKMEKAIKESQHRGIHAHRLRTEALEEKAKFNFEIQ